MKRDESNPFIVLGGLPGQAAYFRQRDEEIKMKRERRRALGKYKLEEAAETIEKETQVPADETLRKLFQDVGNGLLLAFEPDSETPYEPRTMKEFYEKVHARDLNTWLDKNKKKLPINWRFPEPPNPSIDDNTAPTNQVDWKVKVKQIADGIARGRWEKGIRQITARNIVREVTNELAKDQTTFGTRGRRSEHNVRTEGLRGWKFLPPKDAPSMDQLDCSGLK
jgi:hypothetical protein